MVGRLRAECRMRKPAEHAEPIVDRHHDEPALCERAAVVERIAARPGHQRTAVNPDKDRGVLRIIRRPDVERQAILAHRSEERRVGKEWVSKCSSRWSPYNYKNKNHNQQKTRTTNEQTRQNN